MIKARRKRTSYLQCIQLHIPYLEKPSCLQATLASLGVQKLSQIEPQVSLKQTSRRPSIELAVPATLKSPLLHVAVQSKN